MQTTTITNNAPNDYMFTLPVFYRVQVNFKDANEIFQHDYIDRESVNRIPDSNKVAGFRIRPYYAASLDNSLYETQSL